MGNRQVVAGQNWEWKERGKTGRERGPNPALEASFSFRMRERSYKGEREGERDDRRRSAQQTKPSSFGID